MSESILQVKNAVLQADRIVDKQYHTYAPYTSTYNNNDEIRIAIQSQDVYVLPAESYLFIEFVVSRRAEAPEAVPNENPTFTQTFAAHFFSEMRYEINGFEVDRSRSPGLTSMMKCLVACKAKDSLPYQHFQMYSGQIITNDKTYNILLPLRFIFGFCDDFRKILLNSKHELILMRSQTDQNVYTSTLDLNMIKFTINKIHWKIPHITLSDEAKLTMLRTLNRNDDLPIAFRSWDLYDLPAIPETTRHNWTVKTATQLTKPRFVIVGLQTKRNNSTTRDIAAFDNCAISDVKLYLNNDRYPYDNLNSDFEKGFYHELFYLYGKIQHAYYNEMFPMNPIQTTYADFANRTLFVFDCSQSDDSIKTGMVDVRIEIQARKNIPANTAAYCLIIHDNLIWYSPFTSFVHRDI